MTVERAVTRGFLAGLLYGSSGTSPMINTVLPGSRQLILCDEEPDSRRRLADKLTGLGFPVLATGHLEIASGLIQEQTFAAMVVSTHRLLLSSIAALVDARRARPELPIVVILSDISGNAIPPGLADLVLVKPGEGKLRDCLNAFLEVDEPMLVAC